MLRQLDIFCCNAHIIINCIRLIFFYLPLVKRFIKDTVLLDNFVCVDMFEFVPFSSNVANAMQVLLHVVMTTYIMRHVCALYYLNT